MGRTTERDLYAILGIAPGASPEEIRTAYLARVRVVHPDRFDQQHQPQEWQQAHEMLTELNEAYSILRSPTARAEYDQMRGRPQAREAPSQPPPRQPQQPQEPKSAPFELGDLTPGHATFADLPKHAQERLRKRQENQDEDQVQIRLAFVSWYYVLVGVLLCWFLYLYVDADGAKWGTGTLVWYATVTVTVGLLIGWNMVTIVKWQKAVLKPYFYVTPLYFIKTEYDEVSFYPIWSLKDASVTHKHKNGSYQSSDVVLQFNGHKESLTLYSMEKVKTLVDRIRTYDNRLRAAYARGHYHYFVDNDDFSRVPRPGAASGGVLPREKRNRIYIGSVGLCALAMFAAMALNEDLSQKAWVRLPSPTAYTQQPTPPSVSKPSHPEEPLPGSGSVRSFTGAERIAPFQIKAAQGSHYLVKLVDTASHHDVLTVFVQSGATVDVDVPLGSYEVRYASGDRWYGYDYLFGPDTIYSKADTVFTFRVMGDQVSGYTITLYQVANGNLHTSRIGADQF